ncbi:predicted protein [Nematostella vectensis]|uniref:Inositol-1-monophosphatase n=1 Tax=Nematostella vectensis TaxID=45351 RepID=A7S400_NEMVE|nr:predicted protein [Nematostella vectensis]|eukprot:XP_001633641.1 predicted protein [Nematostella vectensis]
MEADKGIVDLQEFLNTGVDIAKTAGKMTSEAFHKDKSVLTKGCSTDLVTETDQNVEKFVISSLKEKFPSHRFIGEESVVAGQHCDLTDTPTWIIDPIDGTTNFVHRYPFVCISIALAINKEIVVGIIYNSVLDELYTAVKGKGSYCNNKKLTVSTIKELNQALVITEIGSDRSTGRVTKVLENLRRIISQPNLAHSVRCQGSAALNMCSVAKGLAEVYYEFGVHCWDFAAGILIITEAGGFVCDPSGGPVDLMSRRVVACCSQEVAHAICKLIDIVDYPRD